MLFRKDAVWEGGKPRERDQTISPAFSTYKHWQHDSLGTASTSVWDSGRWITKSLDEHVCEEAMMRQMANGESSNAEVHNQSDI